MEINLKFDKGQTLSSKLSTIESCYDIKILLAINYGDVMWKQYYEYTHINNSSIKPHIFFIYIKNIDYSSFTQFISIDNIRINKSEFIGIEIYDAFKKIYNHDIFINNLLSFITYSHSYHYGDQDFIRDILFIAKQDIDIYKMAKNHLFRAKYKINVLRKSSNNNNLNKKIFHIIRHIYTALYITKNNNMPDCETIFDDIYIYKRTDLPLYNINIDNLLYINKYESDYLISLSDIIYDKSFDESIKKIEQKIPSLWVLPHNIPTIHYNKIIKYYTEKYIN